MEEKIINSYPKSAIKLIYKRRRKMYGLAVKLQNKYVNYVCRENG
jgi:hypothetical protein